MIAKFPSYCRTEQIGRKRSGLRSISVHLILAPQAQATSVFCSPEPYPILYSGLWIFDILLIQCTTPGLDKGNNMASPGMAGSFIHLILFYARFFPSSPRIAYRGFSCGFPGIRNEWQWIPLQLVQWWGRSRPKAGYTQVELSSMVSCISNAIPSFFFTWYLGRDKVYA